MQQWGLEITQSTAPIDDMTYTYFANSNKLQAVTEPGATVIDRKLGDFTDKNKTSSDYGYDINGNLITDLNKKLVGSTGIDQTGGSITYNYLNLPQQINAKQDDGTTAKGTITYTYDAGGNKLKKVTTDVSTAGKTITTTTAYIGPFVYETKSTSPSNVNDYANVLQLINHEEGRVRYLPATVSFTYDYFIKDHLGNVRMVLTEEAQTDAYPVASMETATAAAEKLYYSKIDEKKTSKPSGYPADSYTNPNAYAAKVNGSGNKIGAGIVLKVMAGDQFSIRVNSWYKLNGVTPGTPVSPITDLLNVLTTGVAAASSGKVSQTQLSSSGVLSPEVTNFLSSQTVTSGKPKAYINWVFFTDQFKYVTTGSSFEQVGGDQVFTTHTRNNLPINVNGYLYIYVSNETPNIDVFFDNLQVTHIRGPLIEETHYYPFGLTMAGISSKAAGSLINRKKFNDGTELQSGEFSDGSGLELYATQYRSLDPQIGRFWQLDPLDGLSHNTSLYAFASNNPILRNDPLGLKDTVAVDSKVLPTIYISIPKKKEYVNGSAGFYWPNDNATKDEIKQQNSDRYLAMDRLAHNQNLLQGGESDNYKSKLDWYKLIYKNEKDYKTMSLAASLIIMSPLLVSASPEIAALIRELPALMNATGELYGDVGLKVFEIVSKLSFQARISVGVLGGMISNGTSNLSQQQLQKIFDAANTLSKYDNSGAMKDIIRNLGPIVGALKRHLQK